MLIYELDKQKRFPLLHNRILFGFENLIQIFFFATKLTNSKTLYAFEQNKKKISSLIQKQNKN